MAKTLKKNNKPDLFGLGEGMFGTHIEIASMQTEEEKSIKVVEIKMYLQKLFCGYPKITNESKIVLDNLAEVKALADHFKKVYQWTKDNES